MVSQTLSLEPVNIQMVQEVNTKETKSEEKKVQEQAVFFGSEYLPYDSHKEYHDQLNHVVHAQFSEERIIHGLQHEMFLENNTLNELSNNLEMMEIESEEK